MKALQKKYEHRVIVLHLVSLGKLKATSMLPWENVRGTAKYLEAITDEMQIYEKGERNLSFKFAEIGKKNKEEDQRQIEKQKAENPECTPQHIFLTQEGLTVAEAKQKDDETQKLLDTESKAIDIPDIDEKVIQKLYNDSQERIKKLIQDNKGIDAAGEPFFDVDDVRAFEVLGLLK